MALSAGANITGLNHTFQQLITQLALYKMEIPGKVPKTEILIRKYSIICIGVVALASPAELSAATKLTFLYKPKLVLQVEQTT